MAEGELRGGPIAPTLSGFFRAEDLIEMLDRIRIVTLLKQVD